MYIYSQTKHTQNTNVKNKLLKNLFNDFDSLEEHAIKKETLLKFNLDTPIVKVFSFDVYCTYFQQPLSI